MRGFVYKIESDCKQILYIGSTTQKLNKRFKDHKTNACSISKYFKDTNYSFSNGCELIKEYNVIDKIHLLAYEQLWMNVYRNRIVNKKKAYALLENEHKKQYEKQYRESHKEHKKQYDRKYRESNKEKISEQQKQKVTCECKAIVSNRNLSAHRKSKKHQNYINHHK